MASSNIAATGVPTTPDANGAVPIRREIRDLQANYKDQWNLYLLGLAAFQNVSETDLLSYYQLAGIHGEPYIPWNDVAGIQNPGNGGYCTHSSILFLTWHRPYLALYEQSLYAIIQGIAQEFPSAVQARYVAAAKDFRMPYWDWAAKVGSGSAFPSAISSQTATVIDTDGATKQINNPLFSFQFPASASEGDLDQNWSSFPGTLRYPDSSDSTAQSNNSSVTQIINRENPSLRNNVSLILLSYTQFDAFSNNQWLRNGRPGTYGSLEDLHNEIHDKVGGGGHMGSLEVSAFDPVFWLHHSNVDRLWAIWQTLNPNSFVTPKASEGNFTTQQGAREDANSQLKPFWNTTGTKFWVSTQVKDTKTFGYAYPETQSWAFPSTQAYQSALRSTVTQEYGGNVLSNFFANAGAATAQIQTAALPGAVPKQLAQHFVQKGTQPADVAAPSLAAQVAIHHPAKTDNKTLQSVVKTAEVAPSPATTPSEKKAEPAATPVAPPKASAIVPEKFAHIAPDNTYTEWITNLRALKHGLSQTFRVFIFLGDFNPDPKTWPLEENLVGRFTVLGRAPDTGCAKCKTDQEDELVVTGTVPLTTALLREVVAGRLHSLQTEEVEPYLVRHLHWRVTLFNGEEKERSEVPGLKVAVVSTEVRIAEDGTPVFGSEYATHPAITDGRPAGLLPDDDV
ncbi:tyrosinase-domain-containing protein [Mytilinidion resinicola]|uniref:tyrosinase n=1 Tax=Mytilinidion resinicola TaxID=574789 RepID=A0A6A6Z4Q4_9PEZI|nr:tyrosinase-domain-containing protein [Mytilinidion resinicola]KAF2815808.1 tyrosinase-domain-containing protein [Mytilinidion resinicola]